MTIKEDLQQAETDAAKLIKVARLVSELAELAGIERNQAANWLAYKGAHSQVKAYLLYPIGYAKEELPLSPDELGVLHYQQVYDVLFDIVHPPKVTRNFLALAAALDNMQKPKLIPRPKPTPAWVSSEIWAFISENGGPALDQQGQPSGDPTERATGRLKLRQEKLLKMIRMTQEDPMNIPLKEKSAIKGKLCETDKLFTDSTFEKAWSALSTAGDIGIDGKDNYAGRLEKSD